jgi:hypothetical protein
MVRSTAAVKAGCLTSAHANVTIQSLGPVEVMNVSAAGLPPNTDFDLFAFEGACPPTFRAEYLPAGATPHCIDFILTAGKITVESAALVFAEKATRPCAHDRFGRPCNT